MSFWSTLFSPDNLVSKVSNGIDSVVFTDQEKADNFLKMLEHYEPFKVAQRFLALTVSIPYVLVWVLCAIMIMVSGFVDPAYGKQLEEAARTLGELNNDTLGFPVSLALGFYFGGGALEGVINRFRNKGTTSAK